MARFLQAALLCCALFAVSLQTAQAEESPGEALSLTAENLNKVSDAFKRLLSNPYDLSKLALPNDLSIERAGLKPETLKAAEDMRAKLRQGLSEVVNIAVDRTSDFVQSAQAELDKAGVQSPELLQRLSSIPVKFDEQGNTLMSNPLTAIGTFLANTLQQQLRNIRAAGGETLTQQLEQNPAGRKLLEEMDAFEASVDQEVLDLTKPAPPQGPVAVARQLDRMMSFMTSLTDAADGVLEQLDQIKGKTQADTEADEADPEGAALRRLQQLPESADSFAQAASGIFTNIFDFFRSNGLSGLVPVVSDLKGIFSQYNLISDLISLIDAPLEGFNKKDFFPLPQNNDEFKKFILDFAKQWCKLETASDSETILGKITGPALSFRVDPFKCPIYKNTETGRNYVSFEDCSPAVLKIKVDPLKVAEAYFTSAKYSGTECRYVEPYGNDYKITIGGGKQSFTFAQSVKGIDIKPIPTNDTTA